MQLGDPGSKKSKQIIRGIIGILILLFVIAFRKEWLWLFGITPASGVAGVLPPGPFLFFNCLVGFLFVFLFWNVLLSFQALLPITDFLRNPLLCLLEAYRTSFHLLLHVFGLHGPAIAVRNGKANTTTEDVSREGKPGVVVIDFNSAVVLEERHPSPGLGSVISRFFNIILEALLLIDASESPRVCGPGIVFTHPRERIRGVVDLRKQFRLEP